MQLAGRLFGPCVWVVVEQPFFFVVYTGRLLPKPEAGNPKAK